MKIVVIQGENTNDSFKRLIHIETVAKQKNWQITKINEESLLKEILISPSLFKTESLYIMENPKKLKKGDILWLAKNAENLKGNMIIFEKGILSISFLKYFGKNIKVEEYKLQNNIFKFLESFYPSSKTCINYLHQVIENEPIEFIFLLLSGHLKNLYLVKCEPSAIPFASWRVKKLEYQAEKFTLNKLKRIIKLMAEIDIKAKTSKSSLIDSLDLLIASELE
ncbi:hypothetical protein A2W13_00755 [Candidatus Woesebacteria bacterium RBG_16_36_11]|uniref:DNA polymerase III delta N-terminal domain-containing protein n=2 Tax=Candidatus Woeseibacteriota TaxID=1752722 RepID=A0A1F7XBM6_9BACT|nr:MAG: hypothetical protein A2W13_00755 [Candidatus Woesebacteria bacterium RBG_16_36_11]OGM16511.1 MAG: hypothetical protein A2V55_02420 [Candidatus Woesebacteria bacterium RBG_19FT_COMBO_37_29]